MKNKLLTVFVTALFAFAIVYNANGLSANIDFKPESSYSVSPNPFTNTLTLTVDLEESEVIEIRICNLIGKVVKSINLEGKTGLFKREIDLSNQENGIYFVNIYSKNGLIQSKKIVKVK